MIRSHNPGFHLRYRLVQTAIEKGIRAASRLFGCSRNTVRKWLRRYQEEGEPGLKERSRAPRRIPHKTPPELEQTVLQARDAIPCFGPQRLKQEFGLPCSAGAIGRILRQAGRSRRRKTPRPPVHSLARQKIEWRAFGLFEIDVKDLNDLAGYRELIPFGLPRFQFTARMGAGRNAVAGLQRPQRLHLRLAVRRPSTGSSGGLRRGPQPTGRADRQWQRVRRHLESASRPAPVHQARRAQVRLPATPFQSAPPLHLQ